MAIARIPLLTARQVAQRLVEIDEESHALALAGTQRAAAPKPVPENMRWWAKDAKKGRLSVFRSFRRWVRLMAKRRCPEGRALALAMLDLQREVVDLLLPEEIDNQSFAPSTITPIHAPPRRVRAVAFNSLRSL